MPDNYGRGWLLAERRAQSEQEREEIQQLREAIVLQHARQQRHNGNLCPWCRDVASVVKHYTDSE